MHVSVITDNTVMKIKVAENIFDGFVEHIDRFIYSDIC